MRNLKLRRLLSGLSMAQISRRIGYSRVSVWEWETGRRAIPGDARLKLAKAYGCTRADLEKSPLDGGKARR